MAVPLKYEIGTVMAKIKNKRLKAYDWNSVDWSMQDILISEKLGCSRERVRQIRALKNIPKPRNHRSRRPVIPVYLIEAEAQGLDITTMRTKDFINVLGISKNQARNFAGKLPSKTDWTVFSNRDFELYTDAELSAFTGCCKDHIKFIRLKRGVYRYPSCKWRNR
jgi:hypothetical protein